MNTTPQRVLLGFLLALGSALPGAAVVLENVDHETAGLSGPGWLSFSPDGIHLYAINTSGNNGIAVFERESTPGLNFGELSFVQSVSGGGPCGANSLKNATSVVVSPDGLNVYVTSRPSGNSHSLSAYARDTGTGLLTCVQRLQDKVNLRRGSGLSMNSTGTTLYVVTTSAQQERVSAYTRNPATGLLTFFQSIKDGTGGANALATPTATAVSPNGQQLYVTAAADRAITRFTRNVAGSLSAPVALIDNQGGVDGLQGVTHLATSPDGLSVYTAAPGEDKVGIFARNPANGNLTFLGVQTQGAGGVTGLDGVSSVAVSPDGAYVFGASIVSSALTVFNRNPATGGLAFIAAFTDPGNLDGARFVAASPDSQCVYVSATTANNIEGYCLTERDYGDAPAPFATLAADAGARHTLGATAFLGPGMPDSEADGQPSALADGDDLAGVDDENGVLFPGPVLAGQMTILSTSGNGLLDGWIDYNGDGDWDDAGEKVVTNATLGSSPSFTAPALTVDGFTFARFRAHPASTASLAADGGAGDGDVEDMRIAISSESFQVAVTKAGNGLGTVTSTPAGIDCGASCTMPFADGENVHLVAAAETVSSTFGGWSGASAGECTGTTCDFNNLAANKAVTATFTLKTFTLTTSVSAGNGTIDDVGGGGIFCGTGGVNCTEVYNYGTEVQLTAVPDPGWLFTGWTGACTNVTGDCVVTITGPTSVQATFGVNVFLLSVNPEGGPGTGTVRITNTGDATFIDCTAQVPADPDCTHFYTTGTNVSLTQTPNADSRFTGWADDCTGTGACNLTMNQSHLVTSVFDLNPDLRVVVNDDFTSRPNDGGVVTIVATVSSVAGDPSGNATVTSVAMTNVNAVTWTCVATNTTCDHANGSNVLNESVDLSGGASLTFTFTGTAPTPAFDGVTTSVTVTSPNPDLVPADNTDSGFFGYLKIFFDGFETNNLNRWSSHVP